MFTKSDFKKYRENNDAYIVGRIKKHQKHYKVYEKEKTKNSVPYPPKSISLDELIAEKQKRKYIGFATMQYPEFSEKFGVNCISYDTDQPTYAKMYDELGDADMAVLTAVPDDNGAYGRVIRRGDGTVEKIVEFKDASEEERKVREINTGIYAFKTESLFEGLKLIKNENAQHEYYLTDLVEILQNLGKKVIAINCDDWREVEGINDCVAQAEANAYLQHRINLHWMKEGVNIIDPDNTYIGPEVSFGHDVIVHPNTYLYGKTTVKDNTEVMPGTFAQDKEL